MSDDVERFDRWSKTYEGCWGQRFFDGVHELMIDLVIAAAPAFAPSAILDVGCGTGRLHSEHDFRGSRVKPRIL